jgi:hypothetical protein
MFLYDPFIFNIILVQLKINKGNLVFNILIQIGEGFEIILSKGF